MTMGRFIVDIIATNACVCVYFLIYIFFWCICSATRCCHTRRFVIIGARYCKFELFEHIYNYYDIQFPTQLRSIFVWQFKKWPNVLCLPIPTRCNHRRCHLSRSILTHLAWDQVTMLPIVMPYEKVSLIDIISDIWSIVSATFLII